MRRQPAETGCSRSPLGGRSGISRRPQSSADLKQPAREGRLQPDGSKRPAMGSLCWYPMGKLRMQRSGQMPSASDLKRASAGGDCCSGRPGGRPAGSGQQGLRAAGLGREKDTAGPRGTAVQGSSRVSGARAALPALKAAKQGRRCARRRATHGRARRLLASKAPGRMALPG